MKYMKLSLFMLLFSATNTYAAINANPGFYVGGAISDSFATAPPGTSLAGVIGTELFSFGLRPTVGYRFNDYLALEGGYLNATDEKFTPKANDDLGPDEIHIYSFDLAVKGIIPFESGFSLFAKTGLAYTHQYVYNKVFISDLEPLVDKTSNRLQPLVGVGLSYNFTKKFASELSYTYYVPSNDIGKISMVALGLTYSFGSST